MASIVLSLLMGAILGFSAHRAGLCTVKAAAEILTSRRGYFLWSFMKSAAWVMALTAVVGAFGHATNFTHWPLTSLSVLGGVLFGIGAGLNGGSTFSTLSRAVDGNIGLWVTVAAWPIGMWPASTLPLSHPKPVVVPQPNYLFGVLLLLCMALLGESILIVRRFWRKHTCGIGSRSGTSCNQPMLAWSIVGAAVLGMAFSSLQRGSFILRLPGAGSALRHGAGGLLMGVGTVLVPGGNDGLILFAIPSLSPHAIPAYTGIFAGILTTLTIMRAFGSRIPPVQCSGDICRVP